MSSKPVSERSLHILELLMENDVWRSGEEISSLLGISRAAVAKHVAALRSMGHAIEAAPKRGYRLLFANDALNAGKVAEYLTTSRLGRSAWRILERTVSTNNEAVAMALEGAEEGTVVIAEQQTGGRGSKGKGWFSAPRSLQFSLILRPEMPPDALAWLTAAGTLAVADALDSVVCVEATVKSPNDVLLQEKKVAGILAESAFRGQEADWAVLGIGCNVNTLADEFPPDLQASATSLVLHTGRAVSRNELLAAILNKVEYRYASLKKDRASITKTWERRTGER